MAKVAIYARYSCEKQNEASIEDQVRRCREHATRVGLIADDTLIYSDAAASGTDKGDAQREGYRQLRLDWDAGKFDALIVDEFSRLSRDAVEQAVLMRRLEKSVRVRLITTDGIDTRDPDWQLRLGLQGLIAQQESRKMCHRIVRGMEGKLISGYMIATPAYGYAARCNYDPKGKSIGTDWVVHEEQAAVVRSVFAQRALGKSMHQIAADLNSRGVPCRRQARKDTGGYWRPSAIKNMLANTIYRGVFVWHGSAPYQFKMRKRGESVETKEYARPHLRLVSDETWHRCNAKIVHRSGYGGARHHLSGLLNCGQCNSILAVSAQSRCRSLYCPNCTVAKKVDGQTHRLTSTIATRGVDALLQHALHYFASAPFMGAFRKSLELRLAGDQREELLDARLRLKKLKAAQQRLARMLTEVSEDDPVLREEYERTRDKVQQAQERLTALEQQVDGLDRDVAKVQLELDPAAYLDKLLVSDVPPHRLQTVLRRLFPRIVFEGKHGPYMSFFRVHFSPGVLMAEASGTVALSEREVVARFTLQYTPVHRRKHGFWRVVSEVVLEDGADGTDGAS